MNIEYLARDNNELIHEIEKEFIDMMLLLDNEREQDRFNTFTLMKITRLKANNKLIRKLSS